MRDEAISHVLERLPHHRDALGTAAVKRLREDTVLDGSTCARQKSVSFADGSVWQRAPYHKSRASRPYGLRSTSHERHERLGTPEVEHADDKLAPPSGWLRGYRPLEQAAKLTSVEEQGSMYAPRTRDHQRRTTRAGARATSSSGTQRRQCRERARPHGQTGMRRTVLKSRAAPYSYFTPEAGGANGEGYHNLNHTFYQQPVLNVP